jgi:tetratricopeptide (TPR) repeat protein
MRLLEYKNGEISLTADLVTNRPPYAILSHTWGPDDEEVKFKDLAEGTGENKPGYKKIKFCAQQAERDGLRYFWVDSCCIDKSNAAELSEAIISMFRWYREAARCYVYLSDVSIASRRRKRKRDQPELAWEPAFRTSKWFTRGWTLQELLAPASVEFFTREGEKLGDKQSLEQPIHEISRIAPSALRGTDLSQFTVEERFEWAKSRKTTREEDLAYCLLGIFGVSMPALYGEGKEKAIQRLKREINGTVAVLHKRPDPDGAAPTLPCHYIPLRPNRRFVGREETLHKLRDMLFHQGHQRVALVGLGGIGKTQVALEIAQWSRQHKPDHSIFWVPALSDAGLEQAYAEIARMLSIQRKDKDEDLKDVVRRYLSSDQAGPWLFIVDNADEPDMVRTVTRFLPSSNTGKVLFTTRSPDVALAVSDDAAVQLGRMSMQEAKDVLQKWLGVQTFEDDAAAEQLLQELTCLPLAITQAAAYLTRNRMPVTKYLGLLRRTEKDMVELMSREFKDNTRYEVSQNGVATTWLVSFEQIRRSDSAAAELLSFLSQIEPKAIPQPLLPRQGSDEQTEYAIGTLCGYAFLERRDGSDIFDMHSLVHVATRIWIQRRERMEEVQTEALRHVSAVFPSAEDAKREMWRAYLPHGQRLLQRSGECRSEVRYDLIAKVGRCLCADRRFREAVGYLEEVCQWQRECSEEEDASRLASEHWLAKAYLDDRRIKDAILLFKHVVAVQRRTLAEEDHDRLASEHELARAYLFDRRIKDAISILEQIVAVQKRTLAEEDHFRLTSEHELARAYFDDRRIKKAISMFELVVAMWKRTLAEEDHKRLTSEQALGTAYSADRRNKDAMSIFEHVVAVRKRTLAEEDPERLTSEHELARAYLYDRRITEAISIFEHVVAAQKRTVAEEDHERLTSEHELARAYFYNRRIAKAISILEHVVAVRKRTLAEEDYFRQSSEQSLAYVRKIDSATQLTGASSTVTNLHSSHES